MEAKKYSMHMAWSDINPYEVIKVFKNGTVLLDRGTFTHKVNIRRVTPYNEPVPLA